MSGYRRLAGAALSPREREVLALLRLRLTAREIAARLGIAERTVESHVGVIYRKLGVRNRSEAERISHP